MKQEEEIEVDQQKDGTKTRKRKAAVSTVLNRSTRRGRRKQSSQDIVLPDVIPRSDSNDLLLFQSFQCQITRCIAQIPFSILSQQNFELAETTRVENFPLSIHISKTNSDIICNISQKQELFINQELVLQIHGKYSWLSNTEVQSKVIKSCRKPLDKVQPSEIVRFKLSQINSDIFIVLVLKREQQLSLQYRGLINHGNTCYMNSYLQMLFHITQFRKLLFAAEPKERDKFPATLQMLFYRMLIQEKAVSPDDLIKSFGWTKKDVNVQQDVQQFSCLFFEALERTIPQISVNSYSEGVPDLFCGELTHYLQ